MTQHRVYALLALFAALWSVLPVVAAHAQAATQAVSASPVISQRYTFDWQAALPEGAKKYTAILRPADAPSVPVTHGLPTPPRELRVLFDTDDPPTDNIFNAQRNLYKRPQREIALFWNGTEVVRRLSPVPITGTSPHATQLTIAFVTGGAELTLTIDKTAVYDRYFVPGVPPFPANLTFDGGATIGGMTTQGIGPAPRNPTPIRIRAIDTVPVRLNQSGDTAWADFPRDIDRIGRVVCTLTLAKTPNGVDPWDRVGSVYVLDEKGERFEALRFITPYRRAYQWTQDVTDLLPLLTGKRRVQIDCTTYGVGWLASVDFTFYPGPTASGRHPFKVVNLWNATPIIGQADKPIAQSIPPMAMPIPAEADFAAVRLLVTGHGEDGPDAAAEFVSLWRKLTVGGATYQNTLWKDDNYLNPCRPQGGTWKFDRAGWGPGTVVEPWVVDVTPNVPKGQNATFDYTIQPYTDPKPNAGDPARYVIGSQLILYRRG